MINKKITYIASLIQNANVVIDVGCDHCYLAIELLSKQHCHHVVNIDLRPQPLAIGEKNLKRFNLLDKTTNLVNDGLKDLSLSDLQIVPAINKIDYVVIAGMGTNNIIHILQANTLPVDFFIIQTSKNEYQLRNFLIHHGYTIISEYYLEDDDIYYPIMIIEKKANQLEYSREDLYFGKINHIKDSSSYYRMLVDRRNFLETTYQHKWHQVNARLQEEYQLLLQRIKKYENQ